MSYNILKYNEIDGASLISYSEDSVELFNTHVSNLSDDELVNPILPSGVPIKHLIKVGDTVVTDIDYKKSSTWYDVKIIRDSKYKEDITTTEGTWQVDEDSIKAIEFCLINLTDDLDTVSWRGVNNINVEITKIQLNSILEHYASRRNSIFNASINVKGDIDACTTLGELEALDLDTLLDTYIS
jgi:hypothetical protein